MLISKNLLLVQIQRNKKRNSRIINYFVPTTNYGTPELEAAVPGVSSYFNAIITIQVDIIIIQITVCEGSFASFCELFTVITVELMNQFFWLLGLLNNEFSS